MRVIVFFSVLSIRSITLGAVYESPNFIVFSATEKGARVVSERAEEYRRKLAVEWLGEELPRWEKPCKIIIKVGNLGVGGTTNFRFDGGHVGKWVMRVQGDWVRILDSVLPHEIMHTLLASYFRMPLPRWADEGIASLVESEVEIKRQRLVVKQTFSTKMRLPLRKMFNLMEYPPKMGELLRLYAYGYSLVDYLVEQRGKQQLILLIETAYKQGWDIAFKKCYDKTVEELEVDWRAWIGEGFPRSSKIKLVSGRELTRWEFDRFKKKESKEHLLVVSNKIVEKQPIGDSRGVSIMEVGTGRESLVRVPRQLYIWVKAAK